MAEAGAAIPRAAPAARGQRSGAKRRPCGGLLEDRGKGGAKRRRNGGDLERAWTGRGSGGGRKAGLWGEAGAGREQAAHGGADGGGDRGKHRADKGGLNERGLYDRQLGIEQLKQGPPPILAP